MDLSAITRVNSECFTVSSVGSTDHDLDGKQSHRLQSHDLPPHYSTGVLECIAVNFGKGFTVGAGTRVVLALFKAARGKAGFVAALQKVLRARTTTQWGAFVGLLLALSNTTTHCIREFCVGTKANLRLAILAPGFVRVVRVWLHHYRGMLAGAFGGLSLYALPPRIRSDVAVFVAVRALEVQVRMAVERRILPQFQHGDTLLMMLSSAQAIWSWIFHPQTVSPAYRSFLTTQSQLDRDKIESIRRMQLGLPLDLTALNATRARAHQQLLTDPFIYRKADGWRQLMYPHLSWPKLFASFLAKGFRLGVSLYAPVYAFSLLVFSPSAIANANVWKRTALNTLRSAVFLVMYCFIGMVPLAFWRFVGLRYETVGNFAQVVPALAGFLSGAATLIEKKTRRIELALFVCRHACASLWTIAGLNSHPMVKSSLGANLPVLLFCLSCSHILHALTRHPHVIRPTYYTALCRFFDTDKKHSLFRQPTPLPNNTHQNNPTSNSRHG